MKSIRQGDVLLFPVKQADGQKLEHLTLVEGEVTGHKHHIAEGEAELYAENTELYLRVVSNEAVLEHEKHDFISLPQGYWKSFDLA